MERRVKRFENLKIYFCGDDNLTALTELCKRNMQLQCGIQDGAIWMNADSRNVGLQLQTWK